MSTLYKIYNRTLGIYPKNANRNNTYYIRLDHAQRGLRSFIWKRPQDQFEIHEFEIVFKGVIDESTTA